MAFSDAVGHICEDEIAPVVLHLLCDRGTQPINLNKVIRRHHKWADWAIWRDETIHIVAVRGRIRWQKPQRSHFRKGCTSLFRTPASTVKESGCGKTLYGRCGKR